MKPPYTSRQGQFLAMALPDRLSASGIASRFFFHNNHTTREYRPPIKIAHPARPMA
jgi:hypothetical protein